MPAFSVYEIDPWSPMRRRKKGLVFEATNLNENKISVGSLLEEPV